jgi:hypothetical protein
MNALSGDTKNKVQYISRTFVPASLRSSHYQQLGQTSLYKAIGSLYFPRLGRSTIMLFG